MSDTERLIPVGTRVAVRSDQVNIRTDAFTGVVTGQWETGDGYPLEVTRDGDISPLWCRNDLAILAADEKADEEAKEADPGVNSSWADAEAHALRERIILAVMDNSPNDVDYTDTLIIAKAFESYIIGDTK